MEIIKLENGLTLIMEKFFNIRSTAAGIYVRNGSVNETAEENGISHFIEHMLFKGTENRSARDIAEEIDRMGGQLNAYTTKDHTAFYTRVLDNCFDRAFDVLADMYFNSALRDSEINRERSVIDEEIDMYSDTPDDLVFEKLESSVWKGSALERPVLGTHETIAAFDSARIKAYMKKHYRADNTVISVAGNIDTAAVEKTVRSYFGGLAGGEEKTVFEDIYIPSDVSCTRDIEQQHICVGFKGIPRDDDDRYVMTVMNTILGGGMSSLLFQRIREEKGLAYSVYSHHSTYDASGLFSVYTACSPENGETAKKAVLDELFAFAEGFDDETALANAKQQITNGFLMSLENTSSVMGSIGRAMLLRGEVNTAEKAVEVIEKVTKDDIKKLAQRIFVPGTQSISSVGR